MGHPNSVVHRGGCPKGSKNATKNKPFIQALKRIMARDHGSIDRALEILARKLYATAMEGEQWAFQEIANRLDGKPGQAVLIIGDQASPLVSRIERVIIDPQSTLENQDSPSLPPPSREKEV